MSDYRLCRPAPSRRPATPGLHEIKQDGHRLVAIVAGERLNLISRNGHDRTALFREPFRPLAEAGLPPMAQGRLDPRWRDPVGGVP